MIITGYYKLDFFIYFAGYKTVQVIKGEADAYIHVTRIKKWDICAGNAIIQSVKGRMTTIKGKSVDYSQGNKPVNDDGLLATLFQHEKLLIDLKPVADNLSKGHKRMVRSMRETNKSKALMPEAPAA